MDFESEEEIEEKIRQHLEQVEILKQKLKQRKQKKSVPAQNEEDNQKPSTLSPPMAKRFCSSPPNSLVQERLEGHSERFPTYKKSGTKNQGRELEQTMCGFYALKLVINEEVQEFEMTSNSEDDNIFDIGLTVGFVSGSRRRFLFQLKPKESENINLTFSLEKYIKSISEMELRENTVAILSTNCSTSMKGKISLTEEIRLEQCNPMEFKDFLVNTREGYENAIFEVKSDDLKVKFYLFTFQMKVETTEKRVKVLLRSLLQCDIYAAFESYMRHWWEGNYVLTQHDVIAKISELAFSPFLKTLTDDKCNEKSENLKRAIMDFPLTIVKDCDEDIVENIWKMEESWMDEDFGKARDKYGLRDEEMNRILWYLGKIPLVVRVDRSNEELIKRVMNFLGKSIRNKKIILSGQVSRNDFDMGDTLGRLLDVVNKCGKNEYCSDILRNFKVSLQGRGCVSLENLINFDPDLANLIGMPQLLKMSQLNYLLVGNQKEETSDLHIPRSISPVFVKIKDILNTCRSSYDTFLIVNCDQHFANKLSENRDLNIMELLEYVNSAMSQTQRSLILLSTRSKCTSLQFETISEKSRKSTIYLLQHFDDDNCILLLEKGTKLKFQYRDTSKLVKETDLLEFYSNPDNVFCAPPGTGKSTLMESLYNNCPSDSLAVRIDLINYNSFLAEEPDFETIVSRFLGIDGTEDDLFDQFKKHFWPKRKVYMFLDGLDEVNGKCVKHFLDFVKHVSSQGGNIWVSSGENLRDEICQMLHVVPIEIKELDEDEQRRYIHSKLEGSYEDDQIEKITMAIFRSPDLNNSHNLGIPLQLHMITEMLLLNTQAYENLENENCFVLTKIYKLFFQGKIQSVSNKDQEHLNQILQAYELPALETCLDGEDYRKLQIENESDSLETLKTQGDKFGIIKTVTSEGQTIFHHQTYSEYFACVFFKRNPNKMRLLQDEIFDPKYENFRKLLDIMLAEENPLHLAVIYQDLDQVEHLIGKSSEDAEILINSTDSGCRTALHLAFSYSRQYPPLLEKNYLYLLDWKTQKRRTPEILKRLLQVCAIPGKRDSFGFDCSNYALKSKCLFSIEKLLEENLLTFDQVKESFENCDEGILACCCAQFGYPNILYSLLRQDPDLPDRKKDLLQIALLGCEGDVSPPPRTGNVQCVKLLLREGVRLNCTEESILNEISRRSCSDMLKILVNYNFSYSLEFPNFHPSDSYHLMVYCDEVIRWIQKLKERVNVRNRLGETVLHKAAKLGNQKILEALFWNHCLDVNARDLNGITALHLACQKDSSVIVNMLLARGADSSLTDNEKNSCLHHATKSRLFTDGIIRILINKGLGVNEQNGYGQTPLHLACEWNNAWNLKTLLQQGADPKLEDIGKDNALHYASAQKQNNKEIIKLLIKENIMIANEQNRNGQTPLHIACKEGNHRTVEKLLKKLANFRIEDDEGNSALHYAAMSWDPNTLMLLINKELGISKRNRNGQAPLHLASREGRFENVRLLLNKMEYIYVVDKEGNDALHCAAMSSEFNKDIINLLIAEGFNVDTENKAGFAAIHFASKGGNQKTVEYLIQCGARKCGKCENDEGICK